MGVVTVTVSSNGAAIGHEIELLAVHTRRELNKLPTARLSFIDGDIAQRKFPLSDAATFAPGAEIEIKARWEDQPSSEAVIFKGKVARHSLQVSNRGCLLHVELKDKALALTRGRKSAVHQNMTDADAFSRLIGDAGLASGTVDSSSHQHPALVQYQCSDWDFMLSRAQALGRQVLVVDGAVSVRAPSLDGQAKLKLEFGLDEVYDWDLECDAADQTPGVDAQAWDMAKQEVLSASGAAKAEPAQGNLKGAAAASSLGLAKRKLGQFAAMAQTELQDWADGQLTRSRMAMLRGSVSLAGNGALLPLDIVELSGMGLRFNGRALVSGVAHRIEEGLWVTDLQIGLAGDGLIDDAQASAAPAAALLPAVSGLQIGIVASVQDDPDKSLRVSLRLPLLGADAAPVWARWASPDAGDGRGMSFWPEVGDEVVVGFFNDDPRQPVVLGSLYSAKQPPHPPYDQPQDGKPAKGWFSKSGNEIGFIDGDQPQIFIRTPGKRELLLDDKAGQIKLSDGDGNSLVMDSKGITLSTNKDFKVNAADGAVEISGSSIDLK